MGDKLSQAKGKKKKDMSAMGQVLTRSWYNYNTIYHIDFCMAWYNLCWTSLITAWQHGAWSGVGTVGGAMFGILCKGCTLFSLRTLCWYVDLIYLFKEAWKTALPAFAFAILSPGYWLFTPSTKRKALNLPWALQAMWCGVFHCCQVPPLSHETHVMCVFVGVGMK